MTNDPQPDVLITREEAFKNARRVLDAARYRRDLDRAHGQLAPQVEFMLRRLERMQRALPAVDQPPEDVLLLHCAGKWEHEESIYTSLRELERATDFCAEDLRLALDHLVATGEIQVSRSKSGTLVSAKDLPARALLVIAPDWRRINDARPRPY